MLIFKPQIFINFTSFFRIHDFIVISFISHEIIKLIKFFFKINPCYQNKNMINIEKQ
jgi:hypothetical protein